ncbi:MAG: YihY/virulence factor BrkB family protein [Kofleriaceae bacterium]
MATQLVPQTPVEEASGERTRTPAKRKSRLRTVGRFFKQLIVGAIDDNITDVGAMMAYYAVLALFPMLVFVITLGMLVLDHDTILQGVAMATQTMPFTTRQLIATNVMSFVNTADAGFAIGGAALALWGASRGTAALGGALNTMFKKKETRSWIRRQLLALGVTAAVALMVVCALALLVAGPTIGHWATDRFGLGEAFDLGWNIGRWVGAGLLVMTVWAILYRFLPNTKAPFRIFTPGACIGVILWLGISALFGLYLSHFDSYEATYGALGGGIIFLTWLWLSNVALLFGAEINDVLADFRKGHSRAAAQLAAETDPAAHNLLQKTPEVEPAPVSAVEPEVEPEAEAEDIAEVEVEPTVEVEPEPTVAVEPEVETTSVEQPADPRVSAS